MIPTLVEAVRGYAAFPFLLPLLFAALLTAGVLLVQSLAGWFADHDS